MRFFVSFYKSLFDFTWLKEKRNAIGGWSYLVLLVFFLSGLNAIYICSSVVSTVRGFKTQIAEAPDFKLELRDGNLQVDNLSQPFKYEFSEEKTSLIIDTAGAPDIKNYQDENGLNVLLVAKDKIVFYDAVSKQSKEQVFKDMPNYTLNKAAVLKQIGIVDSSRGYAILIISALIANWFIYFGLYLLNILFCSFLIYLLAKNSTDFKFKEIFKVGLFAVTAPAVLQFSLAYTVGWPVLTVVLFIYLYIIVLKKNKKETVSAV